MEELSDLSRRPHHSPSQVSAEVEAATVAAPAMEWGPGKLRVKLIQQESRQQWPAISTIAAVLKTKGLAVSRRGGWAQCGMVRRLTKSTSAVETEPLSIR